MSTNGRKTVLAGVVLAAGLLGAAWTLIVPAAGMAVPPPALAPYPVPTVISEVGIELSPVPRLATEQVVFRSDEAVARAAADAPGRADINKPYSVQLVVLTDRNWVPDGGVPVLNSRLVWLVRFTGTPQPAYGPRQPDRLATELNVVVDAVTGEVLEQFSYK